MDNCRRIDQSLLCSRYLSVDLYNDDVYVDISNRNENFNT